MKRRNLNLPVTDLQSQRIGRCFVLAWVPARKKWLCQCDCGRGFMAHTDFLRRTREASCGCRKPIDPKIERKLHRRYKKLYPRAYREWEFLSEATAPHLFDRDWMEFHHFISDIGGELPVGMKIGKIAWGAPYNRRTFRLVPRSSPRTPPHPRQANIARVRQAYFDAGLSDTEAIKKTRGAGIPANAVLHFLKTGKGNIASKQLEFLCAALGADYEKPYPRTKRTRRSGAKTTSRSRRRRRG